MRRGTLPSTVIAWADPDPASRMGGGGDYGVGKRSLLHTTFVFFVHQTCEPKKAAACWPSISILATAGVRGGGPTCHKSHHTLARRTGGRWRWKMMFVFRYFCVSCPKNMWTDRSRSTGSRIRRWGSMGLGQCPWRRPSTPQKQYTGRLDGR